jgi:ribonuclease HII
MAKAAAQIISNYTIKMTTKTRNKIQKCLQAKYDSSHLYEIGVDECARGPMFGRVYTAAAVLDDKFDHSRMCDSKKIHSQKKFLELATYIKQNAVAWSIAYIEPWDIDKMNIRQAVLSGMKESIDEVLEELNPRLLTKGLTPQDSCFILVDGNDFPGHDSVSHITVEKGDDTYSSIAAASILAKQAHDQYILELCKQYPELSLRYGLDTNMGYGTKTHMDGIREYGITQWHRKSFGICKSAKAAREPQVPYALPS